MVDVDELIGRLRRATQRRARGGPAWADYADAVDALVMLRDAHAAATRASALAEREACAKVVERHSEECRACCDDCRASAVAVLEAAKRIRART